MDRDAIVREHRRQRALEALEFERDREAAVLEQIGEVVAEEGGPRIDCEAFAKMSPEDVELVRDALVDRPEPVEEDEDEFLEPNLISPDAAEEEDEHEGVEEEIARLERELASSRRSQRAFERYLDALSTDA